MTRQRAPAAAVAAEATGSQPPALAAHLAAARSVTQGLFTWCEARGIGTGPIRVLARSGGAPPSGLEALLHGQGGPRVFRRVVLGRGEIALAEADNLFLPRFLTAGMCAALEMTDTPFGTVVASLGVVRRTLAVTLGTEAGAGAVLAQSALVLRPDGQAIAAVQERFLAPLLG